METYKIEIGWDFFLLLPEVKSICYNMGKYGRFDYKLTGEPKKGLFEENEVEIQCENSRTIFWIGFFLERIRGEQQQRHYDLRDSNEITITVPDGFLLVCKALALSPSVVLAAFAGDLAQHPFITNGSDERMMAKDYFLRAYSSGDEDDEEIFYELDELRRSWGGNSAMDEYKQRYGEELKAIEREIAQRKEASDEPK